MQTFAIFRRNGFASVVSLQQAAERSNRVGEAMADDVRWIRSYVLAEADGSVGSLCIYQATSAEALQRHADKAELPADEIRPVTETVVVRPDP